jgi:hypothetical protein
MVLAQAPHSQKWAVSRCGVSSSFSGLSSVAEIEIEIISNWYRRPSDKEVSGRPQFEFAHCESMNNLEGKFRSAVVPVGDVTDFLPQIE